MKSLPPFPKSFAQYFDWQSVIIYTGWIFLQLFLTVVLPGRRLEGQTLATGSRLSYKCNGTLTLFKEKQEATFWYYTFYATKTN